jgi:predicted RND superfamily exporter protein
MARFVFYKDENKIYKLEGELPPSEAYIVFDFDAESPDDLTIDNGQIRLKTEAEKLAEEKQKKLEELKQYVATLLSQSDYIVIKIAEAETLGNTEAVEQLRQKYATQLQQRETIRQWSEQIKQAIRNAKTLEELRQIEIRYVNESQLSSLTSPDLKKKSQKAKR